MPFFGDIRSLFITSSLLLKRYREEEKGSKYFIFCSWPGFQGLFPYVDEYWSVADEDILKRFYSEASQFRNKSNFLSVYYRNLNQYFFEDVVVSHEVLSNYYNHGITDNFWNKYKHIKRTLPLVPSTAHLSKDFIRELAARGGFKVFIYPSCYVSIWRSNNVEQISVSKNFWITLLKRLVSEKFVPVVCKNQFTYDVSSDMVDKCVYFTDTDVSKLLAAMRATGCVLDLFTGISKLALAARCPFLMVDERTRYTTLKEYEIDDLCGKNLPKQYIFSFPTIIEGGEPGIWNFNILDNIMVRLHTFMPELDRDNWPSTGESTEIIPYEVVRKKKLKRIGTKLLKVPKD